jgi:HK97 gp10 family phage protein
MADFNHIPQAIEAMERAGKEIVKKGTFDVEAAMKSLAAVLTGFMRSAIYSVTSDGSTYGQGGAGGEHLEPELSESTENGTVGWAVAGADYSIFVNNGTAHQAAQPFAEPAADQVRPGYEAAWEKLDEAMRV